MNGPSDQGRSDRRPDPRDGDHPLRDVWDLCERLDQAHADAVRPRVQESAPRWVPPWRAS